MVSKRLILQKKFSLAHNEKISDHGDGLLRTSYIYSIKYSRYTHFIGKTCMKMISYGSIRSSPLIILVVGEIEEVSTQGLSLDRCLCSSW
jgi:hypothetical protein